MSVSDPHGTTSIAAKHTHDALPNDLHSNKKNISHSIESEKSEDGSIDSQLVGEGRMHNTRQAFVITEAAPVTGVHSASGSPAHRPTRSNTVGSESSGAGSPAMAKMYLLQHRQNSDTHLSASGAPAKLEAPIDPLLAPLDCPRPTAANEQTIPASAAASSSAIDSSDQANVLDDWEQIRSNLQGKQLVVFLDYDGTLTPIVSQPSAAIINDQQRQRLAVLATKCPVAIVTGRKLDTIKKVSRKRETCPECSVCSCIHLFSRLIFPFVVPEPWHSS
jgi:hypothetical protein